jgi:Ca-activated chloride channel family protein
MRLLLFLCLLLTSTLPMYAQKGILRGKIIDGSDNSPLVGAKINVQNSPIATSSDYDGNYSLSLKADTIYEIKVSYVGYEFVTVSNIKIKPNDTTVVDVKLPEYEMLQEIVTMGIPMRATPNAKAKKVKVKSSNNAPKPYLNSVPTPKPNTYGRAIDNAALRNEMQNEKLVWRQVPGDRNALSEDPEKNKIWELVPIEEAERMDKGKKVEKPLLAQEKMPEFPGGQAAMMQYITQNIQYPALSKEAAISGKVAVRFTVKKDGTINKPEILRGVSWEMNEEAIRLIKAMPKWTPAQQDGKPIETTFTLPIQFSLSDDEVTAPAPIPQTPHSDYNTEQYDPIVENEFVSVRQNPLSTFSIDVDNAAYTNVRRYINTEKRLPPSGAVRTEECVNYFKYDYPQPTDEHPFSVTTEMQPCPWNDKHHLLMIGLQGKNLDLKKAPPSNLVFLLDVSGSMAEELPTVKAAIKMLSDQMRPQDQVAIVVYAGAAGLVLPSTSGKEKDKIEEALSRLQAGGGTAGGEGIVLAYKIAQDNFLQEGNNRVILVTDGDFNIGVSSDDELQKMVEEKRKSGIFLTCLGIGTGNYNDEIMELLADKGNGNYAYIDDLNEAKRVLVEEIGGTLYTIAKDVKLQIEFNPANISGYRLVGYENRSLAAEDFNNDSKDAGDMGAGHSVTALYEIILPKNVAQKPNELHSVDSLKYQETVFSKYAFESGELLTVKLRYKQPKQDKSILIEKSLKRPDLMRAASNNFQWAANVAAYTLLLRDSTFKGKANYQNILETAQKAKGKDPNGYRQDFIEMIKNTQNIVNKK